VAIQEKIEKYEKEGRFDEDVENDPPSRKLMPDEIEYIRNDSVSKLKTKVAFFSARVFLKNIMRKQKMIIKEIRGIDNFRGLESGAVITCNHFNAFDSFAIQLAYQAAKKRGRKFYRIIREGNYTSFPGFYGFLMRNCDTLPLSSNIKTMQKFSAAVAKLLKDGNYILIYPEQSMWWNYKKPKPLKTGGLGSRRATTCPFFPASSR
jgi:1-acyl-sn-glycerol-3-phosphate acyltransferase